MKETARTMTQGFTEIYLILKGIFNITLKIVFIMILMPLLAFVFIFVYLYQIAKNEAESNS
tara:strand:+ start:141 stop:323 length:183 start_codon:yes stop_codon:yes gene_type:complete